MQSEQKTEKPYGSEKTGMVGGTENKNRTQSAGVRDPEDSGWAGVRSDNSVASVGEEDRRHGGKRASDDDLKKMIEQRFEDSEDLDQTKISVSVARACVILAGIVPTVHAKSLAETITAGCLGVKSVRNQLTVALKN